MAFHIQEPEKIPSRSKPQRKHRILKWGTLIVLSVVIGTLGYSYYLAHTLSTQASQAQAEISQLKDPKISKKTDKNGSYHYGGDNSGIPNAEELAKYQGIKAPMTTWGYAAAPAQSGLANPINVLPVNEGVSNQTLAWGWGTVKPGNVMGKNNNVLAAHNFADGITYASPLQYIDVSKRPKFYQTDGQKLYTYELTDRQSVKAISPEYTNLVAQSVNDKITLVTCDEPNFIVNLSPEDRIVVSGNRISTSDYKSAPQKIKNLFPSFT